MFEVLGIRVRLIVGDEDAFIEFLDFIHESQRVITSVSSSAFRVEAILLISLVETHRMGHFRIHMPSDTSELLKSVAFCGMVDCIFDSGQHTMLEETSGPVKISDIDLELGARFYVFGDDSEVEPVHQTLMGICVRLQVQIVF